MRVNSPDTGRTLPTMMKILERYKCEVCGQESQDRQQIIDCEARGPATYLPLGSVFKYQMAEEHHYHLVIASWTVDHDTYFHSMRLAIINFDDPLMVSPDPQGRTGLDIWPMELDEEGPLCTASWATIMEPLDTTKQNEFYGHVDMEAMTLLSSWYQHAVTPLTPTVINRLRKQFDLEPIEV